MERKVKMIVGVLLLALLANAHAGRRCGGCFTYHRPCVTHHAAVAVPVAVAFPITVYQTSVGLEIEAAVEKTLRDRGFVSVAAQPVQYQPQQVQQPQQGQPQQAPTSNVLQVKCASCHATGNASGGQAWDMSLPLSDNSFVRITEMIGEQVNVPDQMQQVVANLQPNEKASILSEIIALKRFARGGGVADRPRDAQLVPRPSRTYVSPYGRV